MAKNVFTITLSEDGLYSQAYTNVKALHKAIETMDGYEEPYKIELVGGVEGKFTYDRLCEYIRRQKAENRVWMCTVKCRSGNTMEINELNLISK